jgi:hypothetical protein
MSDLGKIHDKRRLLNLFEYLLKERVIISVHIVGTDFDRLTCVNAVKEDSSGNWLLIDLPDGFRAAAGKIGTLDLRFNFNGPDQLEYIFATSGGHIAGHDLILPFPERVDRVQRRKNFRMETPSGTKMLLALDDDVKAVLGLINISIGGALGALIKHNCKGLQGSLLAVNQTILGGAIIVPADVDRPQQLILIKKSEVRRIEHQKERNIYRYAVQFIEVEPTEMKKLTQAIYHFQREFLKKR